MSYLSIRVTYTVHYQAISDLVSQMQGDDLKPGIEG